MRSSRPRTPRSGSRGPFALLLTGAAGAVVLFGALVAAAPPAEAHPTVLATEPPAGYAVAAAPAEVALRFDEQVSVGAKGLVVLGQARGVVATTQPEVLDGGRRVAARPLRPLPPGQYTVRWQVTGEDGDLVAGAFGFAVGAPGSGKVSPSSIGTAGQPAAAVLRWVLFAGLALALGGLAGHQLAQRAANAAATRAPAVRPPVVTGCLLGLSAALGLAAHQLGGGSLLAGLSGLGGQAVPDLLAAPAGRLVVLEAAGFLLAGTAAAAGVGWMSVLALLAVLVGEGARSHVSAAAGTWGSLTVAVHLAAAAIWVGALAHLVRVALRWRAAKEPVRGLFVDYAALAGWLYVLVVATGTVTALLLLLPAPSALLTTGYGRVLLVKLALVAAVSGLALAARARLRRGRGEASGDDRLVRLERLTLVAVLGVTAVLTSLAPPARTAAAALPPALAGPVVRLGTLAGQVTTGIAASEGQLEVRLAVPESDPDTEQAYALTGTLTDPGAQRDILAFTSCPGLFPQLGAVATRNQRCRAEHRGARLVRRRRRLPRPLAAA